MFKVLIKGCEPTRGSKYSACVDLYASEDMVINAGETKLVGLGVAIDENFFLYDIGGMFIGSSGEIERNADNDAIETFVRTHYLQLMLRSSLGKRGLILPNGVGIIDLDYKDEIKMIIHNPLKDVTHEEIDTETGDYYKHTYSLPYEIRKGDRIAQITLLEHKSYLFDIESEEERKGGFGSTGK